MFQLDIFLLINKIVRVQLSAFADSDPDPTTWQNKIEILAQKSTKHENEHCEKLKLPIQNFQCI